MGKLSLHTVYNIKKSFIGLNQNDLDQEKIVSLFLDEMSLAAA